MAALPRLPDAEADQLHAILLERRLQLASETRRSPFAWNLGRERALEALATVPSRRRP